MQVCLQLGGLISRLLFAFQSYLFFLPSLFSLLKFLEKASRVKQDFAFILQLCQNKQQQQKNLMKYLLLSRSEVHTMDS